MGSLCEARYFMAWEDHKRWKVKKGRKVKKDGSTTGWKNRIVPNKDKSMVESTTEQGLFRHAMGGKKKRRSISVLLVTFVLYQVRKQEAPLV